VALWVHRITKVSHPETITHTKNTKASGCWGTEGTGHRSDDKKDPHSNGPNPPVPHKKPTPPGENTPTQKADRAGRAGGRQTAHRTEDLLPVEGRTKY